MGRTDNRNSGEKLGRNVQTALIFSLEILNYFVAWPQNTDDYFSAASLASTKIRVACER